MKVIPGIWEHDKLPKSNTELLRHYTSAFVAEKLRAPVAQWIERQPPELKAAGSNPAGRTIIILRGYKDI